MSQRVYHRLAASILFPFLLVTAITGVSYRWARNAFGFERESVAWLLKIHQGSILPGFTVPYTGITGFGLLFLLFTGFSMMKPFWSRNFQWKTNTYRNTHQTFSSFVLVVLAVTAFTGELVISRLTMLGLAYRWSRNVIGLPKENVGFLLEIHQGSYIGSPLAYTLVSSVCLLVMLLSGVTMIPWLRSLTSNRLEST